VRPVHHPFREIALPVEGLRARKNLAEHQPGKTEKAQDEEALQIYRKSRNVERALFIFRKLR